jgi:D-3-phosphoglycerate dehydrogenase
MKSSTYLINTARGEIIDETALIRALNDGRIGGAGLDVTCSDPLPVDDPLRVAPNTILTGHGAWYSTQSDSAVEFWHKAMAQVALALQGRWPIYPVNPQVKPQWQKMWARQA